MSDGLHQCSMSPTCKSQTCSHAKPHEPSDCYCPALCGNWPGDSGFKPRVVCIHVEQVMPLADCKDCGMKEAAGHYPQDCIRELKRQLAAQQ